MILALLILIPSVAGALAWFFGRMGNRWPRWISLIAFGIDLLLVLLLWANYPGEVDFTANRAWFVEVQTPWITSLGIGFHLAIDGISLLLVMLSCFLGIMATIASWTEIQERVGLFHFNLTWAVAGIIGVFLALDLFLFYFFWELMLVPMYFLIALWGHENRTYASVKFFLFTQAGGLLMLLGILAIYFIHGSQTGIYTFDYSELLGTRMNPNTALLLMLAFLAAFLVKLPALPFHTWLPDAHTEAPTGGSVILAGLLLKTGAYGILRFAVPLFPGAALQIAPWAMVAGVVGILYGAVLAFAQTDLKRLVAYTSVSHMGFVLLGIFAWKELALLGVIIQILCHGVGTGALFMLVGSLQERIHTRDTQRMGGLWGIAPRMGGAMLFFGLASLGLPGMGNFVGEFLILFGTYSVSPLLTAVAAGGLIVSTIYALWLIQRVFYGPNKEGWKISDLSLREMAAMTAMILGILWLGLYPRPFIDTAGHGLHQMQKIMLSAETASPAERATGYPRAAVPVKLTRAR
ncbi:MAG TPA: NADH-quinone oxidoreductase subunit M [Syntrophorhabdales bacterium]|nr:NADH-quinone oxidoreductase subunit M [Syntrophorhabdales bacterium]